LVKRTSGEGQKGIIGNRGRGINKLRKHAPENKKGTPITGGEKGVENYLEDS